MDLYNYDKSSNICVTRIWKEEEKEGKAEIKNNNNDWRPPKP